MCLHDAFVRNTARALKYRRFKHCALRPLTGVSFREVPGRHFRWDLSLNYARTALVKKRVARAAFTLE